jgi:hypothetical protein
MSSLPSRAAKRNAPLQDLNIIVEGTSAVPAQLMLAWLGAVTEKRIAADSSGPVSCKQRDGDMDRLLPMRSDLLSLS